MLSYCCDSAISSAARVAPGRMPTNQPLLILFFELLLRALPVARRVSAGGSLHLGREQFGGVVH